MGIELLALGKAHIPKEQQVDSQLAFLLGVEVALGHRGMGTGRRGTELE